MKGAASVLFTAVVEKSVYSREVISSVDEAAADDNQSSVYT